MKRSGKITTTIGAAAIYAMMAIPAMAGTTSYGTFPVDSISTSGKDISNTLLLVRGGNGHGASSNSHGGSGDQDRDRDRDGSCLDSVTENTSAFTLTLAENGNGSGDQDHDQNRDGSCDNSLTSNGHRTGDRDGEPDRDRDGSCRS